MGKGKSFSSPKNQFHVRNIGDMLTWHTCSVSLCKTNEILETAVRSPSLPQTEEGTSEASRAHLISPRCIVGWNKTQSVRGKWKTLDPRGERRRVDQLKYGCSMMGVVNECSLLWVYKVRGAGIKWTLRRIEQSAAGERLKCVGQRQKQYISIQPVRNGVSSTWFVHCVRLSLCWVWMCLRRLQSLFRKVLKAWHANMPRPWQLTLAVFSSVTSVMRVWNLNWRKLFRKLLQWRPLRFLGAVCLKLRGAKRFCPKELVLLRRFGGYQTAVDQHMVATFHLKCR